MTAVDDADAADLVGFAGSLRRGSYNRSLLRAAAARHGTRVAFLGVNSDDNDDAAATFLSTHEVPYPSYIDPDKKIANSLKATHGFPATAFFNSAGELTYTKSGPYTAESELEADMARHVDSTVHQFEEWGLPIMRDPATGRYQREGKWQIMIHGESYKPIVAEAARNIACTGARPLGITDCLNFGSPEDPEVMWQFVETISGLVDGCNAHSKQVPAAEPESEAEEKLRKAREEDDFGVVVRRRTPEVAADSESR